MMQFSYKILVPFLLVFLHIKGTHCTARNLKPFEFHAKKSSSSPSPSPSPSPSSSPPTLKVPKRIGKVFYPIGYGADATGHNDSSGAILAAVNDAIKLKEGLHLMPGIHDLGGPIIDLQGESFIISNPIRFPPNIGNIVVKGGTLRASDTFPADRHLLELWAPDSKQNDPNKGMKYEDITFSDLLLDSNYRGGGLSLIDSARIRITNSYFVGFTTHGIIVTRGHEAFITDCFLGQQPTVGGDKEEKNFTGTAIDIASTDNSITNVAVFSAAIGIILRGRANIVTNVHCYNKATAFGGVGILIKSAQNRIISAYLDYNSIVIEDPSQVTISDGFFLGDGNIVLKSVQGKVSGLNIMNNVFSGNSKNMVPTVRLEGNFKSVDQVAIERNVVNGMSMKSTVANLNVHGNGTKWVANFSRILLFPDQINHLRYSFYTVGGGNEARFTAHAVTNVSGNAVVIESQHPLNGIVSVSVDQNNMPGEKPL